MLDIKNPYKKILKNWYKDFYSNETYIKHALLLRNSLSQNGFTSEFCTVKLQFPRRAGATTAVVQFIKKHPELNIKIIAPSQVLGEYRDLLGYKNHVEFREKYAPKRGQYIDILFVDGSLCLPLIDEEYKWILEALNVVGDKLQWVVQVGI